MGRWLFLPNSAVKDLEILSSLPLDQVEALCNIVAADTGKTRYDVGLQLAETLGIADDDAAGIYTLWRYAQDERKVANKSGDDVVSEFVTFLKTRASKVSNPQQRDRVTRTANLIGDHRDALSRLFDAFPERDKSRKAYSLGVGPLPHFVNIKAICDVRPVYDEDATAIEAHAAVFTLRIVSHNNQDKYEELNINITEDDIDTIEAEIGRLRKKIAIVKGQYPDIVVSQPHVRKRRS